MDNCKYVIYYNDGFKLIPKYIAHSYYEAEAYVVSYGPPGYDHIETISE